MLAGYHPELNVDDDDTHSTVEKVMIGQSKESQLIFFLPNKFIVSIYLRKSSSFHSLIFFQPISGANLNSQLVKDRKIYR